MNLSVINCYEGLESSCLGFTKKNIVSNKTILESYEIEISPTEFWYIVFVYQYKALFLKHNGFGTSEVYA